MTNSTLYRGLSLRGVNEDDALIEAMRSGDVPAFVTSLVRDSVAKGEVSQWSTRFGDRGQGVGVHWTTDLAIAKSFSMTFGEKFSVLMLDDFLSMVIEATYTPGSEVENPEENTHAFGWNGKDEKEIPLKAGSPLSLVRAHVLVPSDVQSFLAEYDEEGEAQTDSVKWITVPLGLSAVAAREQGQGDCYLKAVKVAEDMVGLAEGGDIDSSAVKICHGIVTGQGGDVVGRRFTHAWVEVNGDTVIDKSNGLDVEMDRSTYYRIGHIEESDVERYTVQEAMVQMLKTGHYGPWPGSPAERHSLGSKTSSRSAPPIRVRAEPQGEDTILMVGKVISGIGYRVIGSWRELGDAIPRGFYRSDGTYTVRGHEGRTQFTNDFQEAATWRGGVGRASGDLKPVAVIEVDLTGMQCISMMGWAPDQHEVRSDGTIDFYPDTGGGIGIESPIPLDQIRRVHTIQDGRYGESWSASQWQGKVQEILTAAPHVLDTIRAEPETYPLWQSWRVWVAPASKTGDMLHRTFNDGREKTVCGKSVGGWYDMWLEPIGAVFPGVDDAASARDFMSERTNVTRPNETARLRKCPACWTELGKGLANLSVIKMPSIDDPNFASALADFDRKIEERLRLVKDPSFAPKWKKPPKSRYSALNTYVADNPHLSGLEFSRLGTYTNGWVYPDGSVLVVDEHKDLGEYNECFDEGLVRVVFRPETELNAAWTGRPTKDQVQTMRVLYARAGMEAYLSNGYREVHATGRINAFDGFVDYLMNKSGSLGGSRLWWRVHPAHREFLPEAATSAPINAWRSGDKVPVRGFSAVGNPWHVWTYCAEMGWLSESGPSKAWRDDVIGFTGTMQDGNWSERGWQADGKRDMSGGDGEPLVIPDMKIVQRFTWAEFERELMDTPFPDGPHFGRPYEGSDAIRNGRGSWDRFAQDLLDGKRRGLWKDGDTAAKIANFIIEMWMGRTALESVSSVRSPHARRDSVPGGDRRHHRGGADLTRGHDLAGRDEAPSPGGRRSRVWSSLRRLIAGRYEVVFTSQAEKDLRKIHPQVRKRALAAIEAYPDGSARAEAVKDWKPWMTLHVGDSIRVLFKIEGSVMEIAKVGERENFYADLPRRTSARVSQLLASGALDEALADADRFFDDVEAGRFNPDEYRPVDEIIREARAMLPKRAASGTVHRGFTLKLSPEVAQRFVAALNANRLSEAGEIAARWAEGDQGGYNDGTGVGVWWSRDRTQIEHLYGSGGNLCRTEDGKYEFTQWDTHARLGVILEAQSPGAMRDQNSVDPSAEMSLVSVQVWVQDPPPEGYTISKSASWLTLPVSIRVKASSASDYGMSHRPADDGPPANDLLVEDSFAPSDVYEHPEWYTGTQGPMRTEVVQAIRQARGAATVTIWRAGPVPEFNTGDWVSLSRAYASQESLVEGVGVFSATVPAEHVLWAGDDLAEWGYFGPTISARTASRRTAQRGVTTSVEDLGEVALYTFTATEGSTVLGTLEVEFPRDDSIPGTVNVIDTRPEYRRQGVATMLMQEAVSVRDSLWPGRAIDMGTFTQDGSKWWSGFGGKGHTAAGLYNDEVDYGTQTDWDVNTTQARGDHGYYSREEALRVSGMPKGQMFSSVDALRRYIETVLRNEGITVPVEIVIWPEGTGQAAAAWSKTRDRVGFWFAKDMMNEMFALHECAHIIMRSNKGKGKASHGQGYADVHARLMWEYMGVGLSMGRAASHTAGRPLSEMTEQEFRSMRVVYHGTSSNGDLDTLLTEGVRMSNVPMNVGRQRFQKGEYAEFQPGAGVGMGLYVSGGAYTASEYGRHVVAIEVTDDDLAVPPESTSPDGLPGALRDHNGAMIVRDVPASRVHLVARDLQRYITGDPWALAKEGTVAAKSRGDSKGTVHWFMPGKKRPFAYSHQATSDLIGMLGDDGLTFNEALAAIHYDPEAKEIVRQFIDAGYGDTRMADIGVRYASLTKDASLTKQALRFSPGQMADWESTKPWNGSREDYEYQRIDGWGWKSARGTEAASYEGGFIKVTEEFLGLPESVRRAVAYHEAGHALLEAGEGLVGVGRFMEERGDGDTFDLRDWPGGQSLSYNAEEIIAEAFSVLWTEPEWFDRMGAQRIRDLVLAYARSEGWPLP